MGVVRSKFSFDFVFICFTIKIANVVIILMWRGMLMRIVGFHFVILFRQLMFLLVSMVSEFEFTPLIFIDWLVMSFRHPCMTTKMELNRLILDVIWVVIRSMFGRLLMIIVTIVMD